MASKRLRTGKWEYVIKRAGVLEKPLYLTFDSEAEGDAYCARVESWLDRGIVPDELRGGARITHLAGLVDLYLRKTTATKKDQEVLASLAGSMDGVPLTSLNVRWVDHLVSRMKHEQKLAPATIRAKIGALARCTDWGVRQGLLTLPDHPFRTLPEGYASYTDEDTALAGERVEDQERDRRLQAGESEAILKVIRSGVLRRKFRPLRLEDPQALGDLFTLALETAMRLSEIYTLGKDQVMPEKRTVFLTKTKNGDKRQVPTSSVATEIIQRRVQTGEGSEIFPWWEPGGNRKVVSNYLSRLFSSIFAEAGCPDLRFHDLRHEATSRFFERTSLSGEEIMKITGHRDHRMFMRYLNLRGSDLANQLW